MTVRPAQPGDHAAFAALFPALGVDEAVPGAADWWAHMGPCTLVAEIDDHVVAYTYFQTLADTGYVRHVAVDAAHRGHGLGRQLMAAVADRLRAAGCTRWCLNVKPGNTAAIALYERVGMRTAFRSCAVRLTWDLLDRLPEDDLSLRTCPIDPAEEPTLAAAFDLPPGLLADLRHSGQRINLRLADPARPHELGLGLASFAPAFPGAFPFRVARPSLARALLTGMHTHALPGIERLQLMIEDDDPLIAALVAAGARVHLELLHLRGPLPPG